MWQLLIMIVTLAIWLQTSLAAKLQWTEGHFILEIKVEMVLKVPVFLIWTLLTKNAESEEQVIKLFLVKQWLRASSLPQMKYAILSYSKQKELYNCEFCCKMEQKNLLWTCLTLLELVLIREFTHSRSMFSFYSK